MRVVIDLQAAQAENRMRGIGRYSLSLALAMARNRGDNEILIALSGQFPESIGPIREAFRGLIPQENIRVWHGIGPVNGIDSANDWRRKSAELIREAFLSSLRPDVVHVGSLFEGLMDDAVTSIGAFSQSIPTAVTLYDLIPYLHPKPYLENPAIKTWYLEKLAHLRRADLWLCISESSRREGIECLGMADANSVNISTDADTHFRPLHITPAAEKDFRQKYGLTRPFVMYTGGIDHRKNIEGLMGAFARLPEPLRQQYQLAIVCSARDEDKHRLRKHAKDKGLTKDDVVLTGFVPEDDLVMLYNLCDLFVFPSWHEGFGLPALEAMRCGALVIGANTSSLPEVIGLETALFDPHSEEDMSAKMERALTDGAFRNILSKNSKVRSELFSWDESARRAIDAMERFHEKRATVLPRHNGSAHRPTLAYISPLPPAKSGIADYSAELLPELAKFYKIDVIAAQDKVSDDWIKAHCKVRPVQWFEENAERFERVLYHFGNSSFHEHMFELLKAFPGVVVLHDFFLSGIIAHIEAYRSSSGLFARELYNSHGYPALRDRFHTIDTADVVWKYPCSLNVIQDSLGVIVHSSNSLRLAKKWYRRDEADWSMIPHLRNSQHNGDQSSARKALGFQAEDFIVCTFGLLGPMKLNLRLLQAWLTSSLAKDTSCHLVFVGKNDLGNYGREMLKTIRKNRAEKNIRITGWQDIDVFRQYLVAADVGVQLRTLSRGETSGTVLDCMNNSLPTIVNANGSLADLDSEAVWKLPDEFTDEQLIQALETLWQDEEQRHRMGETARKLIISDHDPQNCAKAYTGAIERCYQTAGSGSLALPSAIAEVENNEISETDLIQLAEAIAKNNPPRNGVRQLLVDVSELVRKDAKSGIQRVVRNILMEWLTHPPPGYRIEPVYATIDKGYRYARKFVLNLRDCPLDVLQDDPIEYFPGDLFFSLDLQPQVVAAHRAFYQELRRYGVHVYFAVYDLLCVNLPHCFYDGGAESFSQWLRVVAESDGALCISKTVADELADWLEVNDQRQRGSFKIDWFHLGADFESPNEIKELPIEAQSMLDKLHSRMCFLMVGTIEPRKGHEQVLAAFDRLWQSDDQDVTLVIVGKKGWMVEALIEKLRLHPELNKRLFWHDCISDGYLEKIYAASTCLIAASYGEGFGLPLIEAAQHKLPIIARDIPVFREVAEEHAFYFNGETPEELAKSITDWLQLRLAGTHPKSHKMAWQTWQASAACLFEKLEMNTQGFKGC